MRKAIFACFAVSDGGVIRSCSGVLREAVVERRAAEAVAVGDLDDRHAGVVERADDRATWSPVNWCRLACEPSRSEESVTRMSRPCRDVAALSVDAIAFTPCTLRSCWAISSPTWVAAAVMMSRLPAYGGRKSPAPSTSRNIATRAMPAGHDDGSSNCGSLRSR